MSDSRSLTLHADPWLTTILKKKAYRVSLREPFQAPDSLQPFNGDSKEPTFLYAKVETSNLSHLHHLTQIGFKVVDVNIHFERNLTPGVEGEKEFSIDKFKKEDEADVLQMAHTSFQFSRFHRDPKISDATAHEIKRLWIKNYIDKKRGDELLIAYREEKPVGFLALMTLKENDQSIGLIDLIGVHPSEKRRGVGRSLIGSYLKRKANSLNRIRVGTQITNIPSTRLYERCGFQLTKSYYVLHAHTEPK